MEDKRYHTTPKWYDPCLEHCEAFGISKSIIQLFIHIQEQKYEQNNKET